jgi:hypothetical protein
MTRRTPPYRTTEEGREHYIKLTASLISRTVDYTRTMVATWPTKKVMRRYNDAMWHGMGSTPPPDVKWWAARKRAND